MLSQRLPCFPRPAASVIAETYVELLCINKKQINPRQFGPDFLKVRRLGLPVS
jgi:hypothetical protein